MNLKDVMKSIKNIYRKSTLFMVIYIEFPNHDQKGKKKRCGIKEKEKRFFCVRKKDEKLPFRYRIAF